MKLGNNKRIWMVAGVLAVASIALTVSFQRSAQAGVAAAAKAKAAPSTPLVSAAGRVEPVDEEINDRCANGRGNSPRS